MKNQKVNSPKFFSSNQNLITYKEFRASPRFIYSLRFTTVVFDQLIKNNKNTKYTKILNYHSEFLI